MSKGDAEKALEDADGTISERMKERKDAHPKHMLKFSFIHSYEIECVRLSPDWVKGYNRKGAALQQLGRLEDAIEVYEQGKKYLKKIKNKKILERSSSQRFTKPNTEVLSFCMHECDLLKGFAVLKN